MHTYVIGYRQRGDQLPSFVRITGKMKRTYTTHRKDDGWVTVFEMEGTTIELFGVIVSYYNETTGEDMLDA